MNRKDLVGMLQRTSWMGWALSLILTGAAFAQNLEIPVVDGHLGACATTVTVLDSESKPVYNAKVTVDIRYGFLGFRKMSLEVACVGRSLEGGDVCCGVRDFGIVHG